MPHATRPRFGTMTAPSQVDYHDVLRVWREADMIPEIEHAWLFDHLLPIFGNPKPVQRPHPPILIGGCSSATLRVVAEHADLWNIPGGDIDDVVSRSALLDRYCTEIGRDPASIIRSIHLPVSYDQPGTTRDAIGEAIDAGFRHIVLGLSAPYPAGVARWVTDELITENR
ncbi:LLM class flavin-dependent oxidoreductase [Nonomuraea sp. LPB2021202275-12-8]|uniref:LLM class flavin-dependent oxidoreductase n=1 Tax=Nonomuraea sp. LPB2021202275-12-8 TaxID=3120159 RepID=UPI00300D8395